jgi:MarR family transcriptional regulator, organic hydroperoxide resistance regulator
MSETKDIKSNSFNPGREAIKAELMQMWRHMGISSHGDLSQAWMELNLTIAQLKCLFFIDHVGPTNHKSLADFLGVTPPNVTGIVDRLVDQQFVTRHENEANRRMQIIQLTTKSESLLNELKSRRINKMADLMERLSMEDLIALLQGTRALRRIEEELAAEAHTELPTKHQ